MTEKRCGNSAYTNNNGGICARLGMKNGLGLMREHQGNPRPNHYRGVANDR